MTKQELRERLDAALKAVFDALSPAKKRALFQDVVVVESLANRGFRALAGDLRDDAEVPGT